MKHFDVHLAVEGLAARVLFHSTRFSAEPALPKDDCARRMLDYPRVNFAISRRGATPGIGHLGIEVEDGVELREVYARLRRAEGYTTSACCAPGCCSPETA